MNKDFKSAIIDWSSDSVVGLDLDGIIVSWNAGAERLYGFNASEVVGTSIYDHTRNPDELVEMLQQIADGIAVKPYDTVRMHKDRSKVTVSVAVSPVHDDDGTIIGASLIARDVTERAQAEIRSQEAARLARQTVQREMDEREQVSEAKYHAIVDTIIDAIIVTDENRLIQSINSSGITMFGYAPADVVGHDLKMLIPEIDNVSQYQPTGVHGREVHGRRIDGTTIVLDLMVIEWYSGKAQLFTGILRDITTRRQIEQQLTQSQKMEAIGQLTGGMAHDFNNILGVIIGNLDMLSERFDPEPVELADAIAASMTGADLVQRLLAFARRQPLQPKVFHCKDIIEQVIPLLRRTIGDQFQIKTMYHENQAILADVGQFENMVLNLVINARDAMPGGGQITIEAIGTTIDKDSTFEYDIPVGIYSTLIVSDNGVGISEANLARVFEPFFTTKPTGMGSGLGLSMVFGYVRQSGGVVRIYSEINKGTSVRVYFPRFDETTYADGLLVTKADEIALSSLHGTERILIVEDNPSVLNVAQRILTSLGYETEAAKNANEALHLFETSPPFDMLFTDIIMPGAMNGIALAQHIRKHSPTLKIILASGFSTISKKEIDELQGQYITKPYRKLELAKLIRTMFV